MSNNLKPCPFCGSPAMTHENNYHNGRGIEYKISCTMFCDAYQLGETMEEAILRWNIRPKESALESRVAELEAELVRGEK